MKIILSILIFVVVLVLVLVVIYKFSVSDPGYQKTYQAVDRNIQVSLGSFRKKYPGKTADIDGYVWKYLKLGSEEKTILFLHGMAGAYDIWWQQLLTLKDTYKIVSVSYPPLNNLKKLSLGLMEISEAEQIDRVNLVGSSLGGYFSQYLVAHYPEKVERAIFANTFPPNKIIAEKNRTIGMLLPIIPEWAVMRVLRKNTEDALYPASGNSELVKAYMMEQSYGMMNKEQFVARFHCVLDSFEPPDLAKLNTPVMIIEADNDPLVEIALREKLKQPYPSAAVKTLNQVGHFPYLNKPELYSGLIRDFFD